jgi:hypothetical protein
MNKKLVVYGLALSLVTLPVVSGCGFIQAIRHGLTVACQSQEEADTVKAKAHTIMHDTKVLLDTLHAEFALASTADVITTLSAAIVAAQVVLNQASNIFYNVLCPTFEQLGVLETSNTSTKMLAKKALMTAKSAHQGNSVGFQINLIFETSLQKLLKKTCLEWSTQPTHLLGLTFEKQDSLVRWNSKEIWVPVQRTRLRVSWSIVNGKTLVNSWTTQGFSFIELLGNSTLKLEVQLP